MVKTIISTICVALLLTAGAIFENHFVHKQFDELNSVFVCLYEKIDDKTATQDDVYATQKSWLNKKRVLHIFIPHNEIKEIDLWIGESCTLIENKKFEDALSKLDVVMELIEQIPKTFALRIENIL